MAVYPLQELKNNITDRIHENHEQAIDGEDLQEILHDVVDSVAAYAEENQAADKNYVHDQGTPSALWTIEHNLGKNPTVTVYDSSGRDVEGSVQYIDENNLTITFSSAFSGRATLN